MTDDWQIVRVGNLADSISDTHKFGKDQLVFLNTSDILLGKILHNSYSPVKDWPGQAKKSIQKSDILFSEIRPANGRYAFVDVDSDDFVVSTKLMVIRARDEHILPRFLYHYLTSRNITSWLQHLAESRSGTFPQITFDQVAELELPLPPKAQQGAIAAFLDALDDKIELNRRMSRTLEGIARAIFKSWFVDFDPVRAKAAVRREHPDWTDEQISCTACPKLKPEIAALFPHSFEDSELGEIPTGWTAGQLGDCANLSSGYSFKSGDWIDCGVPVVKIGSVKPGIVDLSQVSYVSEDVALGASRFQLKPADLLIGMTGYVGEVGLIPYTDNPPLLNQRVGKFVLEQDGTVSLGFVYCLSRQAEFKSAVESRSHGTAQANVSAAGILSVDVVVPPKQVRSFFDRMCQPLLDAILLNHSVANTFSALRDALLPKLISGELRIPDAERIVGRAI